MRWKGEKVSENDLLSILYSLLLSQSAASTRFLLSLVAPFVNFSRELSLYL